MSVASPTVLRQLSPVSTARLLGAWHAGGPAYVALADAFRAAVLSGTLAPHTRLPSERELAAALSVSRTTTSGAYARLRELGFAISRVGSGTVTTLPQRAVGPGPGPGRSAGGDAPPADVALRKGGRPGTMPDVGHLDLWQATPPAPPELHEAFARALEGLPAYLDSGGYEPYGLATLREAVAARYRERGVPTTADEILVTTGAQQAIALLAHTHLRPGDRAVVESPTYFHAMEAMRDAGGRVVGVPTGPLDVDQLASAVRRSRPRLVYLVPDYQNPTGFVLSADERAAVREIAERHGVTVAGDETLVELGLSDDATPPAFAGDGMSPHVVSVGSASKAFWGGLRVGWVRAHPQVIAQLARARQSADIATAVLEQLAVTELLGRRAEVMAGRRHMLRERRDLLVGKLRESFPWDVPEPRGGLFCWVDLGRPVAQAFAAAAAAEGALVAAGPLFTPDNAGAASRVRLTFTRSPAELADAVPRLVRAWGRVTRRQRSASSRT
ncbi:PLP-dependent aminotransferase family protein [Promicromonospora panici]|uniref:MocR-like transcription factor YczR n=1 Tax=Promicromonospora panici TaxID=2219658 RepID=UPI00101C9359|nr:PLP-dependent aminotransferase family protein [Promicromonospora panici]